MGLSESLTAFIRNLKWQSAFPIVQTSNSTPKTILAPTHQRYRRIIDHGPTRFWVIGAQWIRTKITILAKFRDFFMIFASFLGYLRDIYSLKRSSVSEIFLADRWLFAATNITRSQNNMNYWYETWEFSRIVRFYCLIPLYLIRGIETTTLIIPKTVKKGVWSMNWKNMINVDFERVGKKVNAAA